MTNRCASCDASDSVDELNCPMEWTDYLREERDFGPPIGAVWIPLCQSCYPEADRLKESQADLGMYPEEVQDSIESDITDFLRGLDLGALVDRP